MRLGMTPMIIGGLLLVSLLAMGLTIFINLHKFEAAFDKTVNDRFYFLLEDARDTIEGEMRLGQAIEKLTNAQAALDQAISVDPYILSIEVFNNDARTLYSTDNSFLFDVVPQSWEDAWRKSDENRWELIEDDTVTLGVGLQDLLGQPTGSLVVRYSTELQETTFAEIKSQLIEMAFVLWAGSVLMMLLLLLYLTKPLKVYFKNLEAAITSFIDADQSKLGKDAHVAGFMHGYQAAEQELLKLETTLHKMDEVGK